LLDTTAEAPSPRLSLVAHPKASQSQWSAEARQQRRSVAVNEALRHEWVTALVALTSLLLPAHGVRNTARSLPVTFVLPSHDHAITPCTPNSQPQFRESYLIQLDASIVKIRLSEIRTSLIASG
jgi:hypothetical protein